MERAISLLRYVGEFSLRGSGFDVKAVMPPPTVAKDEATAVRPRPSISYRPESKKHDSSTKEGVLFDKFFDLTVELSEGSGRNFTESEFAKVKNFEDVGFPSRLTANIASAGYTKPTPVQQYAMKGIKDGKDIIACSPTGSGKTAAYLLPILGRLLEFPDYDFNNSSQFNTAFCEESDCEDFSDSESTLRIFTKNLRIDESNRIRVSDCLNTAFWEEPATDGVFGISNKSPCKPRALILVPTRELAIQIHQVIVRFTSGTYCKSAVLYEGTRFEHLKSFKMLKDASIVVGTVDRVMKFVDKGLVSLEQIKFLVLDEADKMLDPSFAEDLKCIMRKGRIRPRDKRQTLLFSATFPALAKERLKREKLLNDDHLMIVIDKIGAANKCIVQGVVRLSRHEKSAKLLELVRADNKKYKRSRDSTTFQQKTLIFVTCKKTADDLESILCRFGVSTAVIRSDREHARRESALDDFRQGRISFLIASEVAERGLDIAGVEHVINYDMPKELDDYVYRIGRCGRIGNAGHSTSFIDPAHDGHIINPLVNLLTEAEQIVPDWLEDCGFYN